MRATFEILCLRNRKQEGGEEDYHDDQLPGVSFRGKVVQVIEGESLRGEYLPLDLGLYLRLN